MKFKFVYALSFLLLFLAGQTTAQIIVQGTVQDASTGEPLPNVKVYLSATTYGQPTDKEGKYRISITEDGIYELVFSSEGFKNKVYRLDLSPSTHQIIDAKLTPKDPVSENVNGDKPNADWQKNYALFKKEFIGEGDFAEETIVENPEVIKFTLDENDQLVATAKKPLMVTNNALGYKLYIELDSFQWSKHGTGGMYRIYPHFKTLKPQTEQQKTQWQKNRMEAYLGSFRHFLKSLHRNDLEENNFTISHPDYLIPLKSSETRYMLFQKGVSRTTSDQFKAFKLRDRIDVSYHHSAEYRVREKNVRFSINKDASITVRRSDNTFLVHRNGTLYESTSVMIFGDWGRSRVAESLPDDYEIDSQ